MLPILMGDIYHLKSRERKVLRLVLTIDKWAAFIPFSKTIVFASIVCILYVSPHFVSIIIPIRQQVDSTH